MGRFEVKKGRKKAESLEPVPTRAKGREKKTTKDRECTSKG
jgi:hypothetical protein